MSYSAQNSNVVSESPVSLSLALEDHYHLIRDKMPLTSSQMNANISLNNNDIEPMALLNMSKLAFDITYSYTNSSDDVLVFTHIYSNNNTNSSLLESDQQFDNKEMMYIIITSLILGFLTLSTVIGNVFVIAAILLERNLRTVGNYLVLSLAVADLMVACLVMPLGAVSEVTQKWTLGRVLCDLWTSADVLCCTASILHLLAIAMDRYWAVTNVDYIHQRNAIRIGLMIIAVWTVAGIVSIAPLFGWKDPDFVIRIEQEKRCLISQDIGYQIFATIATFYGPLIFILALYWKIFQVARKRIRRKPGKLVVPVSTAQTPRPLAPSSSSLNINSSNNTAEATEMIQLNDNIEVQTQQHLSPNKTEATNGSNNNPTSSNHKNSNQTQIIVKHKKTLKESLESKRERKAAKTLAIITGVFVICWLPFFVVAFLMPICPQCEPNKYVFSIFLWLGYLNSLLNPIIYTIFSPDFRNGFRRILCGRYANRRVNR